MYKANFSSCKATFAATSGTAKPILSRHLLSRINIVNSFEKLTKNGGDGTWISSFGPNVAVGPSTGTRKLIIATSATFDTQ